MVSDAHLHLHDFCTASTLEPVPDSDMLWCASAHEPDEFAAQETLSRRFPGQIRLSFGIHPQEPLDDHASFLETLAAERRIDAIGECGFDLFDERFRSTFEAQRRVWNFQLELAIASHLPLVIHCRKAMALFFSDAKRLKKVRAVVFHGWPGSSGEARSFISKGVNAYFSAGKGLLRGDRSLIDTVSKLNLSRILTETDAPWMTSKGCAFTMPSDIRAVTAKAASLAGVDEDAFSARIAENFMAVFGVRRVTG